MQQVSLKIKLLTWQKELLASPLRFLLARCGRRAGKTYVGLLWVIQNAGAHPGSRSAIIGLTSKSVRDTFWVKIKALLPHDMVRSLNETLKEIVLTNGSVIQLLSSESKDSLRGDSLDFVVLDEWAFMDEALFTAVIRPMLADRKGRALFLSSPKGSNHFRRMERWIQDNPDQGQCWHKTIYDNTFISREEIATLKKSVSEDVWKAEFMAEYVDRMGVVYHEFNPASPTPQAYEPARTVTGLDWGLRDYAAAAWIDILPSGLLHIASEFTVNNTAAAEVARAIKARTGLRQTEYVMDASAWGRDGTSLRSVADDYRSAGINAKHATQAVDASISAFKMLLSSGLLTVDPSCVQLRNAMIEWQWGQHEPDVLAAARYGVSFIYDRNLSPLIVQLKSMAVGAFKVSMEDRARMAGLVTPGSVSDVSYLPRPDTAQKAKHAGTRALTWCPKRKLFLRSVG